MANNTSEPDIPVAVLSANTHPHAAEALRLMARKERVLRPQMADKLEAQARAFDAWRERNARR